MKLKNMWKRFWTLDVHNHEGFTLVELIIVIAILAILSTGAIAGYSAYVEKANMTADKAMISEIINVLTMKYYSDGIDAGYVVIGSNGVPENDGVSGDRVAAALEEAYGSNWKTTLKLNYGEWQDASNMLQSVIKNGATNVTNSSFFINSTPSDLVGAFSGVTDAFASVTAGASRDPLDAVGDMMSPEQIGAIRAELDAEGLTWEAGKDNSAYCTMASNLTVKHISNEVGKLDQTNENAEMSDFAGLAMQYAMVYAWASNGSEEGEAALHAMNAAMSGDSVNVGELLSAFNESFDKMNSDSEYKESHLNDDIAAFISIMGTVGDLSDGFSMTTEGLYSSDIVGSLVDQYTTAVNVISGLTEEQINVLKNVKNGEVVIIISSNGAITAFPNVIISN